MWTKERWGMEESAAKGQWKDGDASHQVHLPLVWAPHHGLDCPQTSHCMLGKYHKEDKKKSPRRLTLPPLLPPLLQRWTLTSLCSWPPWLTWRNDGVSQHVCTSTCCENAWLGLSTQDNNLQLTSSSTTFQPSSSSSPPLPSQGAQHHSKPWW